MQKEPATVIDLHIADLLPDDPKPTRKDTSSYRITEEDVDKLIGKIKEELKIFIKLLKTNLLYKDNLYYEL